MPGSTARPVRLLIRVSVGDPIATPSREASSSSRAGSTKALWNARAVFSLLVRTPSEKKSKRSKMVSTSASGPLTTMCAPLSPAMLNPTPLEAAFSASTSEVT